MTLTKADRDDLALALILLRDFKSKGKWEIDLTLQTIQSANRLGILDDYKAMLPNVPLMEIKERIL